MISVPTWTLIVSSFSGGGGTFSDITGSPVSIEWDNEGLTTLVVDDDGSSTDYYRWRLRSEATNEVGAWSDELPASGLGRLQVGHLIKMVKFNPIISDDVEDSTIIDFFNDFQDLVKEEIPRAWWFRKEGTEVSTEASTRKYSITENWPDFEAMDLMLYAYTTGSTTTTYPLTWSPLPEYYNLVSDSNQPNDDSVRYWTLLPPDSDSALAYIGLHSRPAPADQGSAPGIATPT